MKELILMFILSLSSVALSAQSSHFILFCASDGIPGHAFVSFAKEDPVKRMSVFEGSWGLYPESSVSGAKSFVVGEVPGKIKDDVESSRDVCFSVQVSEDEYDKAKSIYVAWQNKNYELGKSDCVSFLIEVATSLNSRISIPPRSGFENLPVKYIMKLRRINE